MFNRDLYKLYINMAIRLILCYRRGLYDLPGPNYKNSSDSRSWPKMPILHFYNNVIVAKCASSKEMIIVEKSLLTRKTNDGHLERLASD